MRKLLHYLFVEENTIFGPQTPSQHTLGEIVTDAVTSPFQLIGWLTKRRGKPRRDPPLSSPQPSQPSRPAMPTVAELRAQLDEDLRNVSSLPIEECEKEEVRAQLQLAFLNKTSDMMNFSTAARDACRTNPPGT